MAELVPPVKLVPEAQIPSFEVLDEKPEHGISELFPEQLVEYAGTAFPYFERNAYPAEGTTLYRLIRGVGALRSQTLMQEGRIPSEETEKLLMAANLQESLILGINGMMRRMNARGISTLKATYIIDDYIERRDQQLWDRNSLAIADDARLFYVLEQGGELPIPGHESETIKDFSGTTAQLGKSVAASLLSMERLRFEWMSATATVEAVRTDAPRDLSSADF